MERIRNSLVTAASAVIIIAGMHAAAPLVNLILVAFLLAMSLTPLMELAIKKGVKPALAVTMTVLVVVVGGLLLSLIVGSSISRMIEVLPTYQPRLAEIRDSVVTYMAGWGIDASRLIAGAHLEPERIIEIAGVFLSAGLSIASSSLIVVLIMVFILIEASSTIVKIRRGEKAGGIMYRYLLYGREVRKYISIVSLSGLITAVGNTILLLILGVDFAVLWGVLSFFLNFVPNLGFIFSVDPACRPRPAGAGVAEGADRRHRLLHHQLGLRERDQDAVHGEGAGRFAFAGHHFPDGLDLDPRPDGDDPRRPADAGALQRIHGTCWGARINPGRRLSRSDLTGHSSHYRRAS